MSEHREVRAAGHHEPIAHPHDRAVVLVAHLDLVHLLPTVRSGDEVLGPVLDPLDRALQPVREQRDRQILRIQVVLGPERAADVGDDDAHVPRRETGKQRDEVPDRVRALGRGPDRQPLPRGFPFCSDAAGLERDARVALKPERSAQAMRRVVDCLRITLDKADPGGDVRALVQDWCVGL